MILYLIVTKELSGVQMKKYYDNDEYNKLYQNYKTDKKLNDNRIKAWSDSKSLAKFYLDFHNCENFKTLKVEGSLEELSEIMNENINDEINIVNIKIKDPDKPYKEKVVQIPMTDEEIGLVIEAQDGYLNGKIDYGIIWKYYHRMKEKYRRIFDNIFLTDIINKHHNGGSSHYLEKIGFDQLGILYRLFPNEFD